MRNILEMKLYFASFFKDGTLQAIYYETDLSRFENEDSPLVFRLLHAGIISKVELEMK